MTPLCSGHALISMKIKCVTKACNRLTLAENTTEVHLRGKDDRSPGYQQITGFDELE